MRDWSTNDVSIHKWTSNASSLPTSFPHNFSLPPMFLLGQFQAPPPNFTPFLLIDIPPSPFTHFNHHLTPISPHPLRHHLKIRSCLKNTRNSKFLKSICHYLSQTELLCSCLGGLLDAGNSLYHEKYYFNILWYGKHARLNSIVKIYGWSFVKWKKVERASCGRIFECGQAELMDIIWTTHLVDTINLLVQSLKLGNSSLRFLRRWVGI